MSGRVHVHKERNDRHAAELQISSTRSKERESHSQKFSSAPGLRTVRSANTISEGRPGKQTGASLLAASPGDHETWARTDGRFPHAQTPLRPSPFAPSPLFAYPTTAAVRNGCACVRRARVPPACVRAPRRDHCSCSVMGFSRCCHRNTRPRPSCRRCRRRRGQ